MVNCLMRQRERTIQTTPVPRYRIEAEQHPLEIVIRKQPRETRRSRAEGVSRAGATIRA